MRKASPELSRARREEIISACASLYETMSFREITIGDIGKKTSFTRTSIYNYFHTKEEIFLALLQREHELWAKDLSALAEKGTPLPAPVFAEKLAATLEDCPVMLRLMAMNLYDMETNSRTERLADFKRSYAAVTAALFRALETAFPSMTKEKEESFLYAFFPFLFGIYPYTSHTEKQIRAMEMAGVPYVRFTISELAGRFIERLLASLL